MKALFRATCASQPKATPFGGSLQRRALLAAAVMLAASWAGSALADGAPPSRSELIRNLLPTVVNISVRKLEIAHNPDAGVAMAGAPAGSAGGGGATGAGGAGAGGTGAAGATTKVAPTNGIPANPMESGDISDSSQEIKGYGGSGFIIDPSGLIVTNYHVVQDAFEITVSFSDGTTLPAKTLSAARLADLALLKVNPKRPLPAAHWGNSDMVGVGDEVFAAGDPFGVGLSVSAGIVSALDRDIQNSPYDDYIQTDATINHGNSGGPLFNSQGQVIGVNSAIISPTTGSIGLGFALPSNDARFVINRLRTYGWVRPSWIGIKVQQVTPRIAEALGMAQQNSSIVSWVLPDGPAEKAGMKIGDIILRFDNQAPSDDRGLLRHLATTPVGDKIALLVRRDGAERNVSITTQLWPRNQWEANDAPTKVAQPKIVIQRNLGLSLSTMDAEQSAKMGLQEGLHGVLVTKVTPYTDPAVQGMVDGDIILRVQDKPVATPEQVQTGIDAARTDKREFVMMLVLPKVRTVPGPRWRALQVATRGG
ncbi:trypsin-like peptidase domain-containing protein [Rhodopila sp.]|uniref:trypsin-like peptidase domain-containing protein n=1 Tax=Rhodopila sp. TaxID=2480087 RepID=UPI003D0E9988